ncbi:hypothetical protein ASPZODRAFT_154689 [Penicilliopsis zonata CBS 506.65]|uniref:NADP-dependent oxidoreductase domain-containing protein n=1 Tax=Penicilliopsis zonata CBS 506.65 TaxID=1073090 RepID=A0A1L9S7S9_9EURO|nr:hypothetical protein ASPZODRAFT_154689 [Penicilliopsis zonata CBS 506.65]OJJ43215.1 hypothetical protein ASPZODRAFT_154689 [Penicilliopsis zonata CBS 506.65]
MGGAGFSHQLKRDPETLPVATIIRRAFDLGLRAIDTSPYYEPSETLLGAALADPTVAEAYPRDQYVLMTKVGRITADKFDYSPSWVRQSVERSLQRLRTSYLDVVFCHDVEFVSVDAVVTAVGTLFELVAEGHIRHVGVSGYPIEVLVDIARRVRAVYGRPLDIVQNWAQLTLQNSTLEQEGFAQLREQGVRIVCSSSPLASGLLRANGVPQGSLGDWHPAPAGLRAAAKQAADWVAGRGDSLAALSLRYALSRAHRASEGSDDFTVRTISGVSSLAEVEQNILAARAILRTSHPDGLSADDELDEEAERRDLPLYEEVRRILGPWKQK